jgi:predicted Zn-dependent protease
VLGLVSAETRALVALGRFDELERVIDQSLATAPVAGSPALVMEEAAKELRAHGHRGASIALASRAVDWHERQPPHARASASAREQLGQALYLGERWEEAGAVFAALLKEQPGDVWYQGWMGAVAARTGDVERARQVAAGLGRLSGRVAALWRATIVALVSEPDAAVALFRDAFAQGLPFGVHLHNSPHLESLRAYGPFVDLMRPEG